MAGLLGMLGGFGGFGGGGMGQGLGLLGSVLSGAGAGFNSRRRPVVSLNPAEVDAGTSGFAEMGQGASRGYQIGREDLRRDAILRTQQQTAQTAEEERRARLAEAERRNQAMAAYQAAVASGDPAQVKSAFAGMDPKAHYQSTVGAVLPPDAEEQQVRMAQAKLKPAGPTDDMREYEAAKAQGFKGSLMDYQLALRQASRPSTQVQLDMKQPGAAATEIGKGQGELYNKIQNLGLAAPGMLGKLNRLEAALKEAPQGALGTKEQRLREYGQALGLNLGNAAPGQMARVISQEMALEIRNPTGGAGMPGAMSDGDRAFLERMPPGLENTPEGNAMLLDYRRRIAQRDADVARLARDYKKKNKGDFDDGFFDELAAWSKANPLFPEAAQAAPANTAAPQITRQQAIDELKRRGKMP